jgi:hypothetical protein
VACNKTSRQDKKQEMTEKLNTMIKNGNSTAKRWAQQIRSQLNVDKLRPMYNKLSYITGKQSNETQMVVKDHREGKPNLYRKQMLLLRTFQFTCTF